jgi:curved DNA-binding protein CbpA
MPPAAAIPAPSLMPPPQSTYVPRSPFSIAPGRPVRAAQPPPAPPPAVAAVLPLAPITPEPPPAVAAVPPLAPITAEPPPAVATLQSPPTSDKPLLDPGSQLVIDQTYELLGENNHYELLGVATDATKEEIRSAYYRLAKLFHPDSRYTWDLGPYQRKMERIFQGLTDAYATLGKKKSRQAYDDYLGIVVRTAPLERALSMPRMEAVKPAARAEAPRAEPDPETEPVASRQRTDPVRREHPRTSSAAVTSEASGPRRVARAAQAKGAVKALARTLNQMSGRTVGIDRATRLITDAKTAEREGNLAGAANAMRIAAQWRPHDQELAREADRLAQAALEANVGQYEQRAGYEERNSMWNEAALSWSRVAKARPQDSAPARRAASMIVKSAGDMREAMRLARHAVDMDPRCVDSRIVLGEVYLATGMKASAQAQLKAAVEIEPTHARAKAMLAELRTRAGRT